MLLAVSPQEKKVEVLWSYGSLEKKLLIPNTVTHQIGVIIPGKKIKK